MPRAHFTKAVVRRVSGAPADGTVQVFQAGTNTPITGKLYKADTGVDEYTNPFNFANGVVDFYLDVAQRVRLVITPSGAGAQVFEDQDVDDPPGGAAQVLTANKLATDALGTYPMGASTHLVSSVPATAAGYPATDGADSYGTVETLRGGTNPQGVGSRGLQRFNGSGTTGGAGRVWTRGWSDQTNTWSTWKEVARQDGEPVFLHAVVRDQTKPTEGFVTVTRGSAGRSGYTAYFKGDGTRLGYTGWSPYSSEGHDKGNILYVSGGAGWFHTTPVRFERSVRLGVSNPDIPTSTSTGVDVLIDLLMS